MNWTLSSREEAAVFRCGTRRLRLGFTAAGTVRVTCTDGRESLDKPSLVVVSRAFVPEYTVAEEAGHYVVQTAALRVHLHRATGALRFLDAHGTVLLREPTQGGRWLTPKPVYRNRFDPEKDVDLRQNVDGARAEATGFEPVLIATPLRRGWTLRSLPTRRSSGSARMRNATATFAAADAS